MSNMNTQGGSFLPDDYIRGKGEQRANIVILLLFGVVLVASVGAFVMNLGRQQLLVAQVRSVRADFESESEKIAQLESLEMQRADLLARAEVVGALIDRVPRSVLISEIVRSMPDNVVLAKISLESDRVQAAPVKSLKDQAQETASLAENGTNKAKIPPVVMPPEFVSRVVLTGVAVLNNDVADFVAGLKRSPLLAGVELRFITPTVVDSVEYRKFEVAMLISRTGDAGAVADAVETTLFERDGNGLITGAETDSE